MALSDYKLKATAAVLSALGPDHEPPTVDARAAEPGRPSDQTFCVLDGTRYEVDHTDGDGKTRTPDEVAAIFAQLMHDGGHTADTEGPTP